MIDFIDDFCLKAAFEKDRDTKGDKCESTVQLDCFGKTLLGWRALSDHELQLSAREKKGSLSPPFPCISHAEATEAGAGAGVLELLQRNLLTWVDIGGDPRAQAKVRSISHPEQTLASPGLTRGTPWMAHTKVYVWLWREAEDGESGSVPSQDRDNTL